MAINKLHDEFHTLDMNAGWEVPAGYPSGIQQKILSGALDEAGKRGSRFFTRRGVARHLVFQDEDHLVLGRFFRGLLQLRVDRIAILCNVVQPPKVEAAHPICVEGAR